MAVQRTIESNKTFKKKKTRLLKKKKNKALSFIRCESKHLYYHNIIIKFSKQKPF